ncbi:hypothetical protein E2C01_101635 [Portunus trituberculatus]|uniref:Uncharacterized protein n=1 Tax=Portunus trituberculatus TaxID=210409 RepID=A0A5B7KGD1_PORTR|nr:hypothetical protein [Portunus trituberculatus]
MASSLKLRVRHRKGRSSGRQVVRDASSWTLEMPETPPCRSVLESCEPAFSFLISNLRWNICLYDYLFCCHASARFVMVPAARPFMSSQPEMGFRGYTPRPRNKQTGFITS